MRRALLVAVITAACGSHGPHGPSSGDDAASGPDSSSPHDDAHASDGATVVDARRDAPPTPDAFPAVLDVRIDCHNTCVLTATPAAINVSAGTSFQVNWINVGDTECDVAKIDQFNQVPIVLGLEPGTSYHDAVRDWCGTQFTGMFQFQISICTLPSYIPVNCGA
jgi:hypothetical protein